MLAYVDNDDFVYVFSGGRRFLAWMEPLVLEEVSAIFDDRGRFYEFAGAELVFSGVTDRQAALALLDAHEQRYAGPEKGFAALRENLDGPEGQSMVTSPSPSS